MRVMFIYQTSGRVPLNFSPKATNVPRYDDHDDMYMVDGG